MQRWQDWQNLVPDDEVRPALRLVVLSDLVRLDFAVCFRAVVDNRFVRIRASEPSASALAERIFCALRRWAKSRDFPARVQTEFWE